MIGVKGGGRWNMCSKYEVSFTDTVTTRLLLAPI
jgi:hypothetical protein